MTVEIKQSRQTFFTFEILLVLCLAVTLKMIAPYGLPILLGVFFAILANPLYEKLVSKGIKPTLSSAIIVVLILFAVIGPVSILSTAAINQGIVLGKRLVSEQNISFPDLIHKIANWMPVDALTDDPTSFENQVRGFIENAGKTLSEFLLVQVSNVPQILFQLLFALITCFFFLIDGKRFLNWTLGKVPLDADVKQGIVKSFQNTALSVIRATLAAALGQTIIVTLGFLILGVPNFFLSGGATFIFVWIPLVGSSPVWLGGAFYLYTQGSIGKAIILVVIGLGAGALDHVIRAVVLGGRSEMHPLVSLIAIFGGLHMFGILGVFIGPILAALLILLLQIWPVVAQKAGFEIQKS